MLLRPHMYSLCALEAKDAECHQLIVDSHTAYAHIECMKESMGLSSSPPLPSCVYLIWLQLVRLITIRCSLCRTGPHVVTACYTAAELQTILTLALQLVRTAQTHSLGSPFLVRQTLPN